MALEGACSSPLLDKGLYLPLGSSHLPSASGLLGILLPFRTPAHLVGRAKGKPRARKVWREALGPPPRRLRWGTRGRRGRRTGNRKPSLSHRDCVLICHTVAAFTSPKAQTQGNTAGGSETRTNLREGLLAEQTFRRERSFPPEVPLPLCLDVRGRGTAAGRFASAGWRRALGAVPAAR